MPAYKNRYGFLDMYKMKMLTRPITACITRPPSDTNTDQMKVSRLVQSKLISHTSRTSFVLPWDPVYMKSKGLRVRSNVYEGLSKSMVKSQ